MNLLFPADLVSDLLPGRRNIVGSLLCRILTGKDLLQFIFSNAVILEYPGNPGFDCSIGVVVGICFGIQIIPDEPFIVTRGYPFIDDEVAVSVGLETGRLC